MPRKAPFPQVIAHRGYNALFPENTMAAFRGALDVGADAIETDLHLSMDKVLVLSHDASLRRCFGVPRKVAECEWDYLRTLQTLREPREQMPRLVDLLEYISLPEFEHVWLLLDIKRDDQVDDLLRCLAMVLKSVPTSSRPWEDRIVLGAWDAEWIAGCRRHLPGFPITFTTPSPAYALAMLEVPNLQFSLLNYSFSTDRGSRFIKQAKQNGRKVFSWSDNADEWMSLSIRNEVDGVITDDPRRFRALCDRWNNSEVQRKATQWTMWEMIFWLGINLNVLISEVMARYLGNPPDTQVLRLPVVTDSDRIG